LRFDGVAPSVSVKSWPHDGQAAVFIGLYVSHWPQAIPISNSIRSSRYRSASPEPSGDES
jgi:hypothetical protein